MGDIRDIHRPTELKAGFSRETERVRKAAEAAGALHASGRQRRQADESPEQGEIIQAEAATHSLHAGCRQHQSMGEDSILKQAVEVAEVKALPCSGHQQHWMVGGEPAGRGAEGTPTGGKEESSIRGRGQVQATGQGKKRDHSS